MKSLILLFAITTIFIFAACDKDPLGIEDNLLVIPLEKPEDTIPTPDVKTKFRADSVNCEFFEKIKLNNSGDTISIRWVPLLMDGTASIDTLGGLKLINFNINTQRVPDTLAEYRKEHILGFNLNLDSFDIVEKYTAEHNNKNYASKIMLQMLPSRKIEPIHGNYPMVIIFREIINDNRKIIVRGKFQLDVPNGGSQQKYDYLFVGEFAIHFSLE